jgi:glycosyltransferase involved in cell wall biosynthesis
MKVLFILPYPLHKAPSQRFRVEAFFAVLDEAGIFYKTQTFFDESNWNILYAEGFVLRKSLAVINGFLRRAALVFFKAFHYDYIFIHREASPIGPPFFEWFIAKVLRKKIIYDFDDAIWIPNTTKENKMVNWVKAFWKIKYICSWANKISAGNDYLCSYASKYSNRVVLMPTCVDTVKSHNILKNQQTEKVIVGWTGSHSTMMYLDEILPVLKKIAEEFDVKVLIISNKPPTFYMPNMEYISWKEETEITDLSRLNIGLMPLKKDTWSEGKCGFKLIQYLALGIPAIASPVGVNTQIIEEGKTGFLCESENDWYFILKKLICSASLRQEIGRKGREKIIDQYSVQANASIFLGLFS